MPSAAKTMIRRSPRPPSSAGMNPCRTTRPQRLAHHAPAAGVRVRPVADLGLPAGLEVEQRDGAEQLVGRRVGDRPGHGAARWRRLARRREVGVARRRACTAVGSRRASQAGALVARRPRTTRAASSSRKGRSTTRSPVDPGHLQPVGARGPLVVGAQHPDPGVAQLAALRQPLRRRCPSKVNPSRQAARRDAQLPRLAHQITVRRPCSSNPQASSSSSARCTIPRPRAQGCAPYAISARRVALVAQLDGAAEARGARLVLRLDREDPAARGPGRGHPRADEALGVARGCRATGTVVQAWLTGSRHCSRTPSTSPAWCARRVTTPSVSTGTSSGKVAVVTAHTLPSHGRLRKPLSLSAWTRVTDHERHAREHRACRRLRPHRQHLRRCRDRAGVAARQPGARDGGPRAAAARPSPGSTADPNRFLAAVQVGVTLAGFLSAAFGGATLAGDLSPKLVDWGVPAGRRGHRRAGAGHARDLLRLPGARRAGPQAARAAARRGASRWRSARPSTGSPGSPGR